MITLLETWATMDEEKNEFEKCLELSNEKENLLRLYGFTIYEEFKEPRLVDFVEKCEISNWRNQIIYFITKAQHNLESDKYYAEKIKQEYLSGVKLKTNKKLKFLGKLFSKNKKSTNIYYPNEQEYFATILWEKAISNYKEDKIIFYIEKEKKLNSILLRIYEIDKDLLTNKAIKIINKVYDDEGVQIPTFYALSSKYSALQNTLCKSIKRTIEPAQLKKLALEYLNAKKQLKLEDCVRNYVRTQKIN